MQIAQQTGRRETGGDAIVRAAAKGVPGNPVIFPIPAFYDLKQLTGDFGARNFITQTGITVLDVESVIFVVCIVWRPSASGRRKLDRYPCFVEHVKWVGHLRKKETGLSIMRADHGCVSDDE
jgi:hypothetical protein